MREPMSADQTWDPDAVSSLRYELGLTQQELSQAIGVRQQTVSEWETGQHRPTGGSVRLLSMVKEQAARYAVTKPAPREGAKP